MRFLLHFANRKFIFALLGVCILALLFVPQQAHAFPILAPLLVGVLVWQLFGSNVVDAVTKPFLDALHWFFQQIFGVVAAILLDFYVGLGRLLTSVLVYFMEIPVVPDPDKLPFVWAAWNFTRSITNGLFLLILVFIGLATILRLQSYQLQRTFPLLIIIILLVNFSGVFVGLVVDIGNLLTHFFLTASTGAPFDVNPWTNDLKIDTDAKDIPENIAKILYFLFGTLLFFILLVVFGLRVIILWTLAILAPLAFAAFILPVTRRWWDRWFGALTQWAFIGVPMSFFIYLAGQALFLDTSKLGAPPPELGIPFLAALAPLAALVLLALGIIFSVGLAGSLGGTVLQRVRRAPGVAWRSRTVGKWKGRTAGLIQRNLIGNVPRGLETASANLEQRAQQAQGLRGWGLRTASTVLGGAARGARVTAGPVQRRLMEYEETQRQMRLPANFSKWDPVRQAEWISSLTDWGDRIQAAKVIADAGNLRFTSPEFQAQFKKDTDKAINSGDAFFQEEINSAIRAYPEDITEEDDIRRRLMRRVRSKLVVDRIMDRYRKGESLEETDLTAVGVRINARGVAQTIKEAKRKYQEARDNLAQVLQKDEDGNDIHVGIDIEYGITQRFITRDQANTNRATAVNTVRQRLQNEGKYADYESRGRERFLRDAAASAVFVRDERSQYIKNIADIDGDDLGMRVGLATGPTQHLREIQQNFGREAVLDIFNGPGGVNDQVSSPEKLKAFARRNPQMFQFLLNNPLGREFPFEGRNQMQDLYDRPTTNPSAFRDRLRVDDLIRNPELNKMYGILQKRRRIEEEIAEARRRGLSRDVIEDAQNRYQDLEDQLTIHKRKIAGDAAVKSLYPNIEREIQELEQLMRAGGRGGGRGAGGRGGGTPRGDGGGRRGGRGPTPGGETPGGGPGPSAGGPGPGGPGPTPGGTGPGGMPYPVAGGSDDSTLEEASALYTEILGTPHDERTPEQLQQLENLKERFKHVLEVGSREQVRLEELLALKTRPNEQQEELQALEEQLAHQMLSKISQGPPSLTEELSQLESLASSKEPLDEAQTRAFERLADKAVRALESELSHAEEQLKTETHPEAIQNWQQEAARLREKIADLQSPPPAPGSKKRKGK